MASLPSIVSFVYEKYPESSDQLSIERLIKIIYLSDWKHAITNGSQISAIDWTIRDFQPWVDDRSIRKLIEVFAQVKVGKPLEEISNLNSDEKRAIAFVIDTASEKKENQLSRLVHSTYPAIACNNSTRKLSFADLAREYNEEIKPQLNEQLNKSLAI